MSFRWTEQQLVAGIKTVTRRLGWWKVRPGDQLLAIRQWQELPKGSHQHILGSILIRGARPERVKDITPDDVVREGFPDMTTDQFIAFFCRGHRISPLHVINRIHLAFHRKVG